MSFFRYSWKQQLSEIAGVLRASQAGGIESGGCRLRVTHDGSRDSIYQLTHDGGNVPSRVHERPMSDERWEISCERWEKGWERDRVFLLLLMSTVYARVGIYLFSWQWNIERDDQTWCSQVMLELRTRNWERGEDGGYHGEKLGPTRTLCATQFTIPNMTGTTSNLASYHTDSRCSAAKQANHTPDFLHPLVPSISFPSLFSISLSPPQPYHSYRTHSWVIPLYISLPWSYINTEFSIYWFLDPLKIDGLPFILMITSWLMKVTLVAAMPSYNINCNQPGVLESSTLECNSSHSLSCKQTNRGIECYHPAHYLNDRLQIDRLQIDHLQIDCLQIDHLQIDHLLIDPLQIDCCQIDRLQINCLQIDLLQIAHFLMDHIKIDPLQIDCLQIDCLQIGLLQVLLQLDMFIFSKCISQLTQSQPPSLHDHGHQVHLQTCSMMGSNGITKLTWSQCPNTSPNSLDHSLQENIWVLLILAS